MSQTGKTLILIRHAHRDTSERDLDNGLSEEGRKQAWGISKELQKILVTEQLHLLSSPKLRCVETLEPLARFFKEEVETDPRLLEQQGGEELIPFKKRITEVLKNWYKKSVGTTIICSHGDWLGYATRLLVGARCEFKKAGWAEIGLSHKKPVLKFRYHAQEYK